MACLISVERTSEGQTLFSAFSAHSQTNLLVRIERIHISTKSKSGGRLLSSGNVVVEGDRSERQAQSPRTGVQTTGSDHLQSGRPPTPRAKRLGVDCSALFGLISINRFNVVAIKIEKKGVVALVGVFFWRTVFNTSGLEAKTVKVVHGFFRRRSKC